MYTQQSAIDPSLAALLQTAKMVTPDGNDTVAAQYAQAAQQKMQPQGIMQGMQGPQGMQGAKQDYAAAAPSMMRNMQQQQMQQMVKQAMQPQPAGIEGLPAPNMQGMAEGGVVGYSGKEGSEVKTQAEEDREKIAAALRAIRDEALLPAGAAMADVATAIPRGLAGAYNSTVVRAMRAAGLPAGYLPDPTGGDFSSATPFYDRMVRGQAEAPKAAPAAQAPQVTPPGPPMSPEAQALTQRQGPRGQASAPSPRPEGRPSAERAPAAGIAQLVAPTPEAAMASARSVLGLGDTSALRKKEDEYLAALKAQPATGQQGLAALQAQQSELQRMYDKAEKESNINSAIQWLLGGREGPGGSARASMAFSEREDARRRTYGELQVANATKRDAIIDLQNAREAGNAKAALEAEGRIRAADMEIAKTEANLAANFASSQANVYGTQMQAETAAANRAQQAMLEGARLKQQAEQNGQMQLANRINAANMTVASAYEKLNKALAPYATLAKQVETMPTMLKDPDTAAQYKKYMAERARLEKQIVDPAIEERDRLARMVNATQDLKQWGEPKVRTGR
jgi:hypothetical protein